MQTLRPAQVCASLLSALEASEGRSSSRKRDQTADSIGLALRRDLLDRAVRDDPAPEAFEHWLQGYVEGSTPPGAANAIARAVLDDWRLAHRLDGFAAWLGNGAPSDDAVASSSGRRS